MLNRRLHGFVGLSLAATLTGCHLPANSPFKGLAQVRPIATPKTNVLPPAAMLHHPGPGVEGPGPGIIRPASYEAAMEAAGVGFAGPGGLAAMAPTSQIGFIGPDGMQVRWDASAMGGFDSAPLVAPGRYDFPQGAIYRLKLTNIAGREGVELYPSLEVAPVTPRTAAYLAHNAIPFQITEEDLDQVTSGNFVTKVVYLPDPDYQELAVAGVETLVSTRLDPRRDSHRQQGPRGTRRGRRRGGRRGTDGGRRRAGRSRRLRSCRAARDAVRRRSVATSPGLRGGHDRAPLRHADHRHADRPARTRACAARRSRRSAEAHDHESHEDAHSASVT